MHNNSTEDKITSSLNNLENFFEENEEAQKYIDSLLTSNFDVEALNEAFEAIGIIYGSDVSQDISHLLSFSGIALVVIENNSYKFEKFYQLIILKFRRNFIRLRNIEEYGITTLMKIAEHFDENSINYSVQRADNTYLNFKVTYDSQLSVIDYYINVFEKYISKSENLDVDDLNDFIKDFNKIKESISKLETAINSKIEEL